MRTLTVTHETNALPMTCMSAGLAGFSLSLPSWDYPAVHENDGED
jgi:hypothetical protein